MKPQSIVLICSFVALTTISTLTNTSAQQLPAESARFDLNNDGTLDETEREVMLNAATIEAFSGRQLTEPEIREFFAQARPGDGPRGFGFGGPRGPRQQEEIAGRFDADGDGKLSDEERKAARAYVQDQQSGREPFALSRQVEPLTEVKDDLAASKASALYGASDLYDENTLRTLYLRFQAADWYEELGDFYRTDVEVPADLIVDGKVYESVGVRFRGSSSYFGVREEKKSFNISINYTEPKQRLYGYRTLNLLNSHVDPSFLREVLYSRIAREYLPAPKANFVKLVINGENWGVYVNEQQFNKDFLTEWFDSKAGVRWKVPPGRQSGLVYMGDAPENYRDAYQLKTESAENAWNDLIHLCKALNQTPDEQLEAALSPILNIDRALWFLALENVLTDNDGYLSRGSDYALYEDANGRFHMIPRDSNESFRYAGGGGPNNWPDGNQMVSPVAHEDNEMLPVISRLLAIPHLRARYQAHLRTIVHEWLDWEKLSPIVDAYQSLIDDEVKNDTKKLYTYEAFATGHIKAQQAGFGGPPGGSPGGRFGGRGGRGPGGATPGLKQYVEERRAYLLSHPELDRPTPQIETVTISSPTLPGQPVQITASVNKAVIPEAMLLYYSTDRHAPFEMMGMSRQSNVYVGEIPAFPAGTVVYYYVEARAVTSNGTTTFEPAGAEFGSRTYRVGLPSAKASPVVINELMAANTTSLADPQGKHEDWIELHNVSDSPVNLSGMYLTDDAEEPRKWQFPDNTIIAAKGYLLIWADGDEADQPGIHASFKLSKNGETLMLIDTDNHGNQLLDSVEFGKQKTDTAFGRSPDGSGDFKPVRMSPGQPN